MPDALGPLTRLLSALCNETDLRLLFARLGLGADLPGAGVTHSKLAHDAADLLLRKGLADAVFFQALAELAPGRLGEVAAVAKAMGVAEPVRKVRATAPRPAPSGEDPKVQDLRDLIAKKQVVIIVGAGVSLAATGNAPTAGWKGLLLDGIARCESLGRGDTKWGERQRGILADGEPDEWINVARLLTARLDGVRGGEFRKWLRETVGALRPVDRTLHDEIAALGCPIATTNYDDLFEQTQAMKAISWDEDHKVDRWLRGEERAVLHLHGHWERSESVVLDVESYLNVRDAPHGDAVRKALRTTKSLLFIGCGDTTQDPNLGAWLRWSGEVFAGGEYRNYRLERSDRVAEIQAQHPASQRLFVVGYGAQHTDLPAFIRRLAPREDGAEEP